MFPCLAFRKVSRQFLYQYTQWVESEGIRPDLGNMVHIYPERDMLTQELSSSVLKMMLIQHQAESTAS